MAEGRKTRANGRASRRAILTAALEVFAERGQRGTSLMEIANRVGMTQPGLLHHFGTKEQLLLEVVQAQEQAARPPLPGPAVQRRWRRAAPGRSPAPARCAAAR